MKRLLYFAIFIRCTLIIGFVSGQISTPEVLQVHSFLSTEYAEVHECALGNNGQYYAAGTYKHNIQIGDSLYTVPDYAGFLACFDQNGDLLWMRDMPCSSPVIVIQGIEIGPDNGIYLTGFFREELIFDLDTIVPYGHNDMMLTKFAPDGEPLWIQTVGGPGFDQGIGMTIDPAGRVYVGGALGSSFAFFGSDSIYNNAENAFVSAYSPQGTLEWVKTDGWINNESITALAWDDNNRLYATGALNQGVGNQEIILARYDSMGNQDYFLTFGGIGSQYGLDIQIDKKGEIYITGEGAVQWGNFQINSADQFLIHIDSTANPTPIDGRAIYSIGDFHLLPFGNYFFTGYDSTHTPNPWPFPIEKRFFTKFDSVGNPRWIYPIYGNFVDEDDLQSNSKGELLLGGGFVDTLFLGDTILVSDMAFNSTGYLIMLKDCDLDLQVESPSKLNICEGEIKWLQAETDYPDADVKIDWFLDGQIFGNDTNAVSVGDQSGLVQLGWVSGSCFGTIEVSTIEIDPAPPTPSIIQGVEDTIWADQSAHGYLWLYNDSLLSNNTPYLVLKEVGEYRLVLISEKGCKSKPSERYNNSISGINGSFDEFQLQIYPNPFEEYLTLHLQSTSSLLKTTIFDLNGKIIWIEKFDSGIRQDGKYRINLPTIPSGIYLLRGQLINGKIFQMKISKGGN